MIRRKILYLIGIIFVLILNMFYIEYQFMVLLVFVLIVPIISLVLLWLSRIDFYLKISKMKRKVKTGDKVIMKVDAGGKTRVLCNKNQVRGSIKHSDAKSSKAIKLNTPSSLIIESKHCRVVSIKIDYIRSFDLLELFSLKKKIDINKEVVFFPEIDKDLNYEDFIVGDGDENGAQSAFDNGELEEFNGVKEYSEGDRLNRVHWKLSAAKDRLLVKEYEQTYTPHIVIFIDFNSSDPDALDVKYKMAYSMGYNCIENNKIASFAAWDEKIRELELYEFDDCDGLDEALISLMKVTAVADSSVLAVNAFAEAQLGDNSIYLMIDDNMVREYEHKRQAVEYNR